MCRVAGSFRQTSDFYKQLFPADSSRRVNGFALDQLSDCRSASHRRHATFGAKSYVAYRTFGQLQAQFQNVSASRIFQPRRCIGLFHDAGISRMLKIVEQFGRIHSAILNAIACAALPVLWVSSSQHQIGQIGLALGFDGPKLTSREVRPSSRRDQPPECRGCNG